MCVSSLYYKLVYFVALRTATNDSDGEPKGWLCNAEGIGDTC